MSEAIFLPAILFLDAVKLISRSMRSLRTNEMVNSCAHTYIYLRFRAQHSPTPMRNNSKRGITGNCLLAMLQRDVLSFLDRESTTTEDTVTVFSCLSLPPSSSWTMQWMSGGQG